MTPEIMRQYLAAHAPELEVVEVPEAQTTEYISREWKVLPAQVAKTLTLRVGEDAIIVVTCGDSRLDNRKVKEELGGKGHMMPGSEASEITGHSVGAITPLCLGSLLPVFFDIGLKRFEEVVTAGARPTQLSESRSLELPSSLAPRGSMSAKRCNPMENGLQRQFNCTCNLPTMKFHLYQFHSGKDDVQCQRFLYKCCGHYF